MRNEKGFALILSLVLLLVMSLMGGSLIVIASGDHRNNNNSDEYQQAFYVAETALMEGEKYLADNYLGQWVGGRNEVKNNRVYDATLVPKCIEEKEKAALVGNDYDFASCDLEDEDREYLEERKSQDNAALEQFKLTLNELSSASGTLVRDAWNKGVMLNVIQIEDKNKSICMNSFKNFRVGSSVNIAFELPDDHPRLGEFWDIVQPLVTEERLYEFNIKGGSENKSLFDANAAQAALVQETNYLKRFKYTFFIQHIGFSTYQGGGTSVQRTTTIDELRQGSAYKIFGCGMYYDKSLSNINILVPLETMVVMPY